jgi:ADP-L-glycero-D-manno-heptose 6-epimerase
MVIVTGGAGFIGSAIVAALNKRGINDILIVDELGTDEKWKNLRKLSYTDYVEAEQFYEELSAGNLEGDVEAIFHMGACSDTTEKNCSFLINNNFECTKLLANRAVENGARFIYASSAATYGDGEKGFVDDEEKLGELIPLNMYGYSKQMFDQWAKNQGILDRIVGLKFFNVYGPNEYHKGKMKSFVVTAFEQINETGGVKLFKSHKPEYADGGQERDFLYIKDCVDMTLFFMDNPDVSGIYNLGTGNARNWNDLAKATFAAMGKEPNIQYIPMPDELQGKYQYYTCADITKLRDAGYDKPTTTLEDAIKDYVQNYLQKEEVLGAE